MAGRSKKPELTAEERRVKVAAMYLQGSFQSEIATSVGVTQQMVSTDLKIIRKEWLASRVRDFDAHIAEQLAKIDELERTHWTAWRESREAEVTTSKKSGTRGDQTFEEDAETVKKTVGNPKFLDGVMKCIEARNRLLGLNKEPEPNAAAAKNTVIIFAGEAKPQHVAEERKTISVPGKVLPPGTSLDEIE